MHSLVAPILLLWRDLVRLALRADQRNMFLDEDQTRNLCCPKSDVESQKRAEAWELIWRSPDDSSGISRHRRWCAWLRENTGNQSVDSLTHRLQRLELLSDYRDELLPQCAQSRRLLEGSLCRTWLVEGDVTSFQPFAAARVQGKAYSEAARGRSRSCQCLRLSSMAG